MPSNDTLPAAPARRSVLRAAAWSLPVVAVSVATPFAAATTAPTLEPVATGAVVLAGQTATVSVRVARGGVAAPGEVVAFALLSPGRGTLSAPTAVAGSDGVATVTVTPTSSNQVITVQASAEGATANLTVVVQRPKITITSSPITDPAAANTMTFAGEGFYNLTGSGGDAYASGVYVVVNEVGDWNENVPLPGANLAQIWINAASLGRVNGAFTGSITIAAGVLQSGTQYALAAAAAHGNSQNPQFHSQAALFTVA